MMRNYKVVTLILFFLLTGCAKLEVAVDILDPEIIIARAEKDLIADAMIQINTQNESTVKVMFTDIRNAHYHAYVKTSESLRKEALLISKTNSKKSKLMVISADNLLSGFKIIDKEYASKTTEWIAFVNKIKGFYAKYEAEKDIMSKNNLRLQLVIAINNLKNLETNLQAFIKHDLNENKKIDEYLVKKTEQAAISNSKKLFESNDLHNSKYAYYVVSAPDDDWAEYYDRSFGSGYFGNVDIAIKAMDVTNFTVKGLSFNPADVANTASKVTSQSVLLAAQIAGVPVNVKGTPTGVGASLANSSSRIHSALASQADMDIQLSSQKDALLKIAQAIIDEKSSVDGTDQERKSSIDSIKAVYTSQSSRLNITNTEVGATQ